MLEEVEWIQSLNYNMKVSHIVAGSIPPILRNNTSRHGRWRFIIISRERYSDKTYELTGKDRCATSNRATAKS